MGRFINTGMVSTNVGYRCFINQQFYVGKFTALKAIYTVISDLLQPIIYEANSGRWYKLVLSLVTDWGSVPALCQTFIPKDRFLGFLFHDNGYTYHQFQVSDDQGKTWYTIAVTKDQVDNLLKEAVLNDPYPGSKIESNAVYEAVHEFGQPGWDSGPNYVARIAGNNKLIAKWHNVKPRHVRSKKRRKTRK